MNRSKMLLVSLVLNGILLGGAIFIGMKYCDKIMEKLWPNHASKILFLGDSLLAQENWAIWLGRTDISNHAFGGAITQQIRWNIERGGWPPQTQICVLNGGINDLFSGVPVHRIVQNYEVILQSAQQHGVTIILNSCIFTTFDKQLNKDIELLNRQLEQLVHQYNFAYCPINEALKDNMLLPKDYSTDGVHLKASAYTVWTKLLQEKILIHAKAP